MNAVYLCPLNDNICKWEGFKDSIFTHFKVEHSDSLILTNEVVLDLSKYSKRNFLMYYTKRVYLIQTEVFKSDSGRKLTIALRYLGNSEEAAQHSYQIHISVGNFFFSNKDTGIVFLKNGIIHVDLENIALVAENNKLKQINFEIIFDKTPPIPEEIIENIYEDSVDGNFMYGSSNEEEEIFETKNKSILRNEDGSRPTFIRRNSMRYSISSQYSKRRSSTIDLDDLKETDENKIVTKSASLLSMLKCTNCSIHIRPPIFSCQLKHNVCILCRTIVCRICDTETQRNTFLEELSKHVSYPCRFSSVCDSYFLNQTEVLSHEICCEYATYSCPYCQFIGNFEVMKKHFNIIHPSAVIFNQLTNPMPPDVTYLVVNPQAGIFLCSSLKNNSVIDYRITCCAKFSIYFLCRIVIMSKLTYKHPTRREGDSCLASLEILDLKSKGVKAKNAVLIISLTEIQM